MALTAEQRKNAAILLDVASRHGAGPKVKKALLETGIVESGLRNLGYGDRDSLGILQQRPSQGWGTPAQVQNIRYAARKFIAAAKPLAGKVGSAAALAQAVQRSAFPERYGKVAGQADALIGRNGGSQRMGAALTASAPTETTRSSDNMGGGADALSLLQSLEASTRQPRATAGLQAPAFSAQPAMPAGAMLPQGSMGQSAQPDLTQLLASIATPGGDVAKTTVTGGDQAPADASSGTTGGGKSVKGFVVGSPVAGQKPHKATHETLGLPGYPAFDYMAPAGTAVVAPVSGKIIKLSGHDPKNGPTSGPHGPFGWSIYLKGDDGKTYFLTHLGSRDVELGKRVKAGTRIGSIGDYSKWGGADHVHTGVHG